MWPSTPRAVAWGGRCGSARHDAAGDARTRVPGRVRPVVVGARVHVHEPVASPAEAEHEYGLALKSWADLPKSSAIVAAVAHKAFKSRPISDYVDKLMPGGIYADVKCQADAAALREHGVRVWRL